VCITAALSLPDRSSLSTVDPPNVFQWRLYPSSLSDANFFLQIFRDLGLDRSGLLVEEVVKR